MPPPAFAALDATLVQSLCDGPDGLVTLVAYLDDNGEEVNCKILIATRLSHHTICPEAIHQRHASSISFRKRRAVSAGRGDL